MKGKITVIFVLMLLIGTAIPVYGSICESKSFMVNPFIQPGNHLKFIFFGGELRSYRFHIPPSYDGNNPVPLVFNLHGCPSSSLSQIVNTDMNVKSDEEGFIVVYPNGHFDRQYISYWIGEIGLSVLINGYRYWNFWDFINANVNDVGYIRTLIENFESSLNINSSRIYITGMSGGGFMSYRLGAELSDIIAAIAPVAGSIGGRSWIDDTVDTNTIPIYVIPEPEYNLPVIVFHGIEDIYVPYEGIEDVGYGLCYKSVNESVAFWVEHNECNPIPDVDVSDSGKIITRLYSNGNKRSDVILYTVVDGGHDWFGGPEVYFPPCEISANDLIWEFFESHPKH